LPSASKSKKSVPHWLGFGGIFKELYDVGVLHGTIRPMVIEFKFGEIRRYISFE